MPGRRSLAALACSLPFAARAQWAPARPVQLIVGFAPGGGADLAARAIAEAATPHFPAPLVVINRPGAGGAIAAQNVAGLPPDGLSLLVGGGSESISLPVFRDLPYDPKTSFRAIIRLTRQPLVIVAKAGRFADLGAAVTAARRAPEAVSHASSGQGSIYHAVFLLFSRAAGIELLHAPFTGGAPALQALLSGTVDLAVLAPEEMTALVQAGEVRPLAVASAARLGGDYAGVPTLRELGFDVVIENMKGLSAPAGTPDAIVTGLHDRLRRGMASPAWAQFLERTGAMDGYLDGPGFQGAMDAVLDALRAAMTRR